MAEARIPSIVNFQRSDLWVHAGYTGEGKTMFALNMVYDRALRGENSLFVSLEQEQGSILNKLYAIHSSTLAPEGRSPLDYRHIRDNRLNSEEIVLYYEVVRDLQENPEYGRIRVWQPESDTTMNDIRLHARMCGTLDLIVVDHSGLVEPSRKYREYALALNSVIREAKELANSSAPVLLLHQMNRRGRTDAANNNGIYELSALGYANEAEKSADHVTASFLDGPCRSLGWLKLSILKTRGLSPFYSTVLHTDLSCRRIQPFRVY